MKYDSDAVISVAMCDVICYFKSHQTLIYFKSVVSYEVHIVVANL